MADGEVTREELEQQFLRAIEQVSQLQATMQRYIDQGGGGTAVGGLTAMAVKENIDNQIGPLYTGLEAVRGGNMARAGSIYQAYGTQVLKVMGWLVRAAGLLK